MKKLRIEEVKKSSLFCLRNQKKNLKHKKIDVKNCETKEKLRMELLKSSRWKWKLLKALYYLKMILNIQDNTNY